VEADEVIIGDPVRGKKGRDVTAAHSTPVFGTVEVIAYTDKHGGYVEKAGRLRLAMAPRADAGSIRRFLEKNVEPLYRSLGSYFVTTLSKPRQQIFFKKNLSTQHGEIQINGSITHVERLLASPTY